MEVQEDHLEEIMLSYCVVLTVINFRVYCYVRGENPCVEESLKVKGCQSTIIIDISFLLEVVELHINGNVILTRS